MDSIPSALRNTVKSARLKRYPKGQIILYQGDELLEVFIIKSGVVKLYDIDEQGNEKILHITKAPGIIPFSFFSGDNARPHWFYSALTDCELYVLSHSVLREAIDKDSLLGWELTNHFSRDVHELLVRLSALGKSKAHEKLIATLWFLAALHASERKSGWWRVNFPVNHQLLADITGITRERAAIVMKEFQDSKIIRNPRLTILEINKAGLHSYTSQSNGD